MTYSQNRQTIRLQHYDYTNHSYYFITICCINRLHLFGYVIDNQMILNDCGKIAHDTWLYNQNKRQNIQLHNFIIMPNHIHAIIEIKEQLTNIHQDKFISQSNTIGSIIRGYKSSVSSQLKHIFNHSVWQKNYYEHIIRNEQSYQMISEYISNNPALWEQDRFYGA
ncbi:Transposase and inactivated derivatives [Moraxella caprae]|uniref:Transposase and inactivated derivatives n=2 Tax=Moraxella caprae TaxID=90240 RepID=A0A378R5R7_9GAMM|nr:transposase [Moraxella caprae]STZ09240.1 Transposase and inactivated derivatives [Moraxella caprae]